MTDEAEVLKAISHGEGQHLEFKRLIDNLESIAGEIVAFANKPRYRYAADATGIYERYRNGNTEVDCSSLPASVRTDTRI
jgi:hypothetical protein